MSELFFSALLVFAFFVPILLALLIALLFMVAEKTIWRDKEMTQWILYRGFLGKKPPWETVGVYNSKKAALKAAGKQWLPEGHSWLRDSTDKNRWASSGDWREQLLIEEVKMEN